MRLEDLPGHVEQLFDYLSSFSSSTERPPDPALLALDERRKAAILATVSDDAKGLTDNEQRLAAAMIDVLWSLTSYRRLINGWGLDASEAARGVNWLISLITDAIRQGRRPS
jgi:hypothetical protein